MITFQQRWQLNRASNLEKVSLWVNYGFTKDEAKAMVKGASYKDSEHRNGGVWAIGNTEYPQAISKSHAEKIYLVTAETLPEPARLVKYINDVRYIIQ